MRTAGRAPTEQLHLADAPNLGHFLTDDRIGDIIQIA